MNDEKKNSWGGKREGAGRKSSGKIFKTVSICGTENELGTLKKQAKEKEKSLSRYIIEELVKE